MPKDAKDIYNENYKRLMKTPKTNKRSFNAMQGLEEYRWNNHSTQSDLPSQHSLHHSTNNVPHKNGENPKIHMITQNSANSQNSMKWKEQNWGHHSVVSKHRAL